MSGYFDYQGVNPGYLEAGPSSFVRTLNLADGRSGISTSYNSRASNTSGQSMLPMHLVAFQKRTDNVLLNPQWTAHDTVQRPMSTRRRAVQGGGGPVTYNGGRRSVGSIDERTVEVAGSYLSEAN